MWQTQIKREARKIVQGWDLIEIVVVSAYGIRILMLLLIDIMRFNYTNCWLLITYFLKVFWHVYTNLLHIFLLNNATIQLILLVFFIYRIVLKEFQTY